MFSTGARIKKLREKRGWNQLEFSLKVGINNSVLSRIETDKRPVEALELKKFAEVLGVSTDELVNKKPNGYPSNAVVEEAAAIFANLPKEDQEHLLTFMKGMYKKRR